MSATPKNVWFITGASSGFGQAFAQYAIGRGYRVVVTARKVEQLKDIVALAPDRVDAIRMDVNDKDQVSHAVRQAVARFGRIDVLFNNAGYGIVGAVEETSEEELRAQMETNFFGAVSVTRSILPVMRTQGSGAIVNISSLGGQLSAPGFSAYSASKFALEGMSEALSLEVSPLGIKVLIVEPGAFRTNFAGQALRHMPPMDAYKETVSPTREFAKGMDGTQAGDPGRAAEAIDKALQAAVTPLRLQLGADAVSLVKQHGEQLLADLAAWEKVALDVSLPLP